MFAGNKFHKGRESREELNEGTVEGGGGGGGVGWGGGEWEDKQGSGDALIDEHKGTPTYLKEVGEGHSGSRNRRCEGYPEAGWMDGWMDGSGAEGVGWGRGRALCVRCSGAGRSGPHIGCGAGGQRSLKRGGMIFGTGKNRFVVFFQSHGGGGKGIAFGLFCLAFVLLNGCSIYTTFQSS